jgi:hypothetical protein
MSMHITLWPSLATFDVFVLKRLWLAVVKPIVTRLGVQVCSAHDLAYAFC